MNIVACVQVRRMLINVLDRAFEAVHLEIGLDFDEIQIFEAAIVNLAKHFTLKTSIRVDRGRFDSLLLLRLKSTGSTIQLRAVAAQKPSLALRPLSLIIIFVVVVLDFICVKVDICRKSLLTDQTGRQLLIGRRRGRFQSDVALYFGQVFEIFLVANDRFNFGLQVIFHSIAGAFESLRSVRASRFVAVALC